MKRRCIALLLALVVSSLCVAGVGAYFKYQVLQPMELCQDNTIMEVPFLLCGDAGLRYIVADAMSNDAPAETEPEETEESTEATTMETEPTETESTETEPEAEPETEPVETEPEYVKVDESWFDDALFIGNSLAVGLRDYARLGEAQYFCSVGMSVFDVFNYHLSDQTFWGWSLEYLLQERSFGKIIIHFGTNESGRPTEYYLEKYQILVDRIRELQPDAYIIIHATITVGKVKTQKMPYLNPDKVREMNEAVAQLAEADDHIKYLDFNTYIAEEDGFLPAKWSSDGCHPPVAGYQEWAQWIWDNVCYLDIPEEPVEKPQFNPADGTLE